MSQELLNRKHTSSDDSPTHSSLNMPIFKSNKRIFLNQLEKYTSDLLDHMEDLDFSQPKELSQITDVLSDDGKSEVKNISNIVEKINKDNKDEVIFPKLQKDVFPSNLYYETKGYKNYKYKFFDIDLDEIGRCQKLGKKFDMNKYLDGNPNANEKTKSLDLKVRDHKKKKTNNLSLLTKKLKKASEGEDLFLENDFDETENDNKNNKSLFPKIMPSKNSKSLIYESNLISRESINKKIISHLINKTDKNESTLVKCERNLKDPLIVENFSVMQKITEPDKLMKIQLNFLNISKIMNKLNSANMKEEKCGMEARKEKNILNDFISLCKNSSSGGSFDIKKSGEKIFVPLETFKQNFDIFRNNDNEINNRILLAFGVNPYNSLSKINWETYLKFKKVIINREASLKENVEFIINV